MTGKYHEAMERLSLSAEARARILEQAQRAGAQASGGGKTVAFPAWKRWAAMAACLVLVLGAAVLLPGRTPAGPESSVAMTALGPEDYPSLEALSAAAGFPVEDLSALVPEAGEVSYTLISGDLAQIVLRDGETELRFRKLAGSEDASGDYNDYAQVKVLELKGVAVTAKGTEEGLALLLWQKDGCSYALSFSPAVPEAQALDLAAALL